jgi:hypothetical protein
MLKDKPTGYEPLYTLKSVAPSIWIVDGGWISFYGIPFPTRMTVIRMLSGDIWVHSPININSELFESVSSLGNIRYLVAPNWIHYAWVPMWQQRFPDAMTYVSPGVVNRAASRGVQLRYEQELRNDAPAAWAEEIDQRFADSGYHREVVFFHRASRSLILTDLIENFEADKMPWWTRPFLRLGGVCDPNGGMPRDMAASFKRYSEHLRRLVSDMIAWDPKAIILAHGRWYQENGDAELKRAFSKFLG